jgi:hypothetical protein
MSPDLSRCDWMKRRFGAAELMDLAREFGLHHSRSGRTRCECPGCRNGDVRGASVGEREGIGVWNCHRDDQHGGTAIDFVALACGLDTRSALSELERRSGLDARKPMPPPLRRPAPPPTRPPAAEVFKFWNLLQPVTEVPDVAAAWNARKLDAATIEERDLARALPQAMPVPSWAAFRGAAWSEGPHRLVLPMFDAVGRMATLHARAASGAKPKGLSPAGHSIAGAVFADPLARLLLASGTCTDGEPAADVVRGVGLIVCEGAPDFLAWATHWSDANEAPPAIIGVVAGSWTREVAARVPDGTAVLLELHRDLAGAKYEAAVIATLQGRCDLRRRKQLMEKP